MRNGVVVAGNIPITEACKRVFKIMSDDYIEVKFVSDVPYIFEVGDYIDDELFGRFYITDKQVGKYDNNTGGYEYQIKFSNQHYLWSNRVFCLTTLSGSASIFPTNSGAWINNGFKSASAIGTDYYEMRNYQEDYPYCIVTKDPVLIPYVKTFKVTPPSGCKCSIFFFDKNKQYTGHEVQLFTTEIELTANDDEIYAGMGILYGSSTPIAPSAAATLVTTADAYERKETAWVLTDKISIHAEEVMKNLACLGLMHYDGVYDYYTYEIGENITTAAKTIDYNGTNIIDALKKIADAFECEWWVGGNVLHFGKCEKDVETIGAEPFRIIADGGEINVESISVSNSAQDPANRVFSFGGTKNIPPSYRRNLVFKINDIDDSGSTVVYRDTTRPLSQKMLKGTGTDVMLAELWQFPMAHSGIRSSCDAFSALVTLNGIYSLDIDARLTMTLTGNSAGQGTFRLAITRGKDNTAEELISTEASFDKYPTTSLTFRLVGTTAAINFSNETIYLRVFCAGINTTAPTLTIPATTFGKAYGDFDIDIIYKGETKNVTYEWTEESVKMDGFICSGFTPVIGDTFEIASENLNEINVPFSYYTDEYEEANYGRCGERRLLLPKTSSAHTDVFNNGDCYVGEKDLDNLRYTETAVKFEGIFPRMALQVGVVTPITLNEEIQAADNTTRINYYTAYRIELSNKDAFWFTDDWILDSTNLEVKFLTREEGIELGMDIPVNQACMLAGMTFKVLFNPDNYLTTDPLSQVFEIVRNEDFGVKLPNLTLYPTVGDPFIFIGWNVRAITSTDLIANAEAELLEKAAEYYNALQGGDLTFTCKMMSDSMRRMGTNLYLADKNTKEFHVRQLDIYAAKGSSAESYIKINNTDIIETSDAYNAYFLFLNRESLAVEEAFRFNFPSASDEEHFAEQIARTIGTRFLAFMGSGVEINDSGLINVLAGYGMAIQSGSYCYAGIGTSETTTNDFFNYDVSAANLSCYIENGELSTSEVGLPLVVTDADDENYELLTEGDKVVVYYPLLDAPFNSRVIGYEFKLDIPYDTPQYTIGESDAFSRLKKIEKELTKLS